MNSALSVQNLSKNFGGFKALDNVSFEMKEGEIFGFLGPNGAGKTTTIRCILDFIRPELGSIKIFDKSNKNPLSRQGVGFLPSEGGLYENWTSIENIKFQKELTQGTIDESIFSRFDVDLNAKVKHLSSGNKQKLAFLMSLIGKPRLLILDEPTRSLDPIWQNEIHSILLDYQTQGGTVFLSSHNLVEVEKICKRVGVIKNGQLIKTETVNELKQKQVYLITAVFSGYFDNQLFNYPEIELLDERKNQVKLRVSGDIKKVIKILGNLPLKEIEISHASLEEVFLKFYD